MTNEKIRISELELKEILTLHDEMNLSIVKAITNHGDNTIETGVKLTNYHKFLGEKYNYDYQKFGINPKTGIVVELKEEEEK